MLFLDVLNIDIQINISFETRRLELSSTTETNPGTPKQILVLTPWMAIHISRVGSVMSVLDGKTEVFVAIHVTSGTT